MLIYHPTDGALAAPAYSQQVLLILLHQTALTAGGAREQADD